MSLKREFESFLEGQLKSLINATPEDVRLYLVGKDVKGKTKIHDLDCPFVGKAGTKECYCPKRLAAGAVCSFVGQLKSLFEDFGRKDEWVDCGTIKYGNPVSSKVVSMYIEAVKLEQSTAHVPIKQAK